MVILGRTADSVPPELIRAPTLCEESRVLVGRDRFFWGGVEAPLWRGPVTVSFLAAFLLLRCPRRKPNQTTSARTSKPPMADPTPMPAFAPVLRPSSLSLSAHRRPRAKTWLMMTDTVGAVSAEDILASTAELIDARTPWGTETVVDIIL